LINKGFTILKNIANFFCDVCVFEENDSKYHIKNIVSMSQKTSNDNTMTNYFTRLTLSYALQACYETNYVPNDKWLEIYFGLDMSFFDDNPVGIPKYDKDSVLTDTYEFLEMVIPLLNIYNENYFQTNISRNLGTIENIYQFYELKVKPAYENHPINNVLLAWLQGQLCALDKDYTETFYQQLLTIIAENVTGLWGDFRVPNGSEYNDMNISCMFLLMFMTSIGTLRLSGSVSETRFYNTPMGFKSSNCYSMPHTFKNFKITGVGVNKDSIVVINDQYY
jgi:hypothetical protein